MKAGEFLWVRETIWCANDTDQPEFAPTIDCGSMLKLGELYAQHQYAATPECCATEDFPYPGTKQTVDAEHLAGHVHQHGHWELLPPKDWDGTDEHRGEHGVWTFLPTGFWTQHPSIHMPRWASRISLEIVSVRVEKLMQIDDWDAEREGVKDALDFALLWDALNGERCPWASNPTVRRIEFKRVDAIPAGAKAHPILFSAPMVRAILEGKKTVTRRLVK